MHYLHKEDEKNSLSIGEYLPEVNKVEGRLK
jgi:hypothetical protein